MAAMADVDGGAQAPVDGLAWSAGQAVPGRLDASPWWLGSLSKTVRRVGLGVSIAAVGAAVFGILTQAATSAMQADEEREIAAAILPMKAEQRWLVGQGLAQPRRIGSVGEGWLVHSGVQGHSTHLALSRTIVGDLDASRYVLALDDMWSAAGGASFVQEAYAISVGDPRQVVGGFKGMQGFVYRHEEAHALSREFGVEPEAPAAWSPEVARVLAQELRSSRQDASPGRWRAKLLRELWDESFADAYAVLSNARRGPEAFKREALAANATRALPSEASDEALGAWDMSGNGHAVDMASFLAGQLDSAKVAKLGAADLRALAGGVADASMAWGLARQAPSLDFFNRDGLLWWNGLCAESGVGLDQAKAQWGAWSKQSLQSYPDAAFGSFSWTQGGVEFKAKGLDASAKRGWRFDGHAGATYFPGSRDPGDSGPQSSLAGAADVPAETARAFLTVQADRPAQVGSFDAAAAEELLMAKLLGAPKAPAMARLAKVKSELLGTGPKAAPGPKA